MLILKNLVLQLVKKLEIRGQLTLRINKPRSMAIPVLYVLSHTSVAAPVWDREFETR